MIHHQMLVAHAAFKNIMVIIYLNQVQYNNFAYAICRDRLQSINWVERKDWLDGLFHPAVVWSNDEDVESGFLGSC
jgi:hypothetical protein